MKTKLERRLGDDLLPKAVDVAAARAQREALDAYLPVLREDVMRLQSLTERARLSRQLVQRTEVELLCDDTRFAVSALDEAASLLAVDERTAPLLLVTARRAWANILLGVPEEAAHELRRILRVDDVTVRGWSDQLLLWLAAAYFAQGDHASCLQSLTIAEQILANEPKRNPALVHAALARVRSDDASH